MPKHKTPKATLRLFTYAVNRFSPFEPQGFRAEDTMDAPLRASREAAYQDYLRAHYKEN